MYPIGIAFGLLVIQYGYEWWAAPLFSGLIFAGSTEMLVIALVVGAAPLGAIALTTLLVNFRHVFYAFSYLYSFIFPRIPFMFTPCISSALPWML